MIKLLLSLSVLVFCASCSKNPSQLAVSSAFSFPELESYQLVQDSSGNKDGLSFAYTLISGSGDSKETMPVYIDFTNRSDAWIIHLHGGPSGNIIIDSLSKLTNLYNIIYFQQRGAADAVGPNYENINISTNDFMLLYIQDLAALVKIIKTENPNSKVVLYGESWGVTYAIMYLLAVENRTYFDESYRVDGVICDSGSIKNVKLNFEASLAELDSFQFIETESSGALNSESISKINTDFSILRQNALTAIDSVESNLTYELAGETNAFTGYINTLFDYIINMEYFSFLKFGVNSPVKVQTNKVYEGPLDNKLTIANNNSVVITDLRSSDYFSYTNRYIAYTQHSPLNVFSNQFRLNDESSSRGNAAYNLLYPILFDFDLVLRFFDVNYTDVPTDTQLLFFYGQYDFRFRHGFNSGSSGMCASFFSHFDHSNDDSQGNCQIKDAFLWGHVVRSFNQTVIYNDVVDFMDRL